MGGCDDDNDGQIDRPYPPLRQAPLDQNRDSFDPSLAFDLPAYGHLGYDPALGLPDTDNPVQDQYAGTWVLWEPINKAPGLGKMLAKHILEVLDNPYVDESGSSSSSSSSSTGPAAVSNANINVDVYLDSIGQNIDAGSLVIGYSYYEDRTSWGRPNMVYSESVCGDDATCSVIVPVTKTPVYFQVIAYPGAVGPPSGSELMTVYNNVGPSENLATPVTAVSDATVNVSVVLDGTYTFSDYY